MFVFSGVQKIKNTMFLMVLDFRGGRWFNHPNPKTLKNIEFLMIGNPLNPKTLKTNSFLMFLDPRGGGLAATG